MRLQAIGLCVVSFVSFFAVAESSTISPSLVGLALAYALPLTGTLSGLIGSTTETEKEIVSVERVLEYMNVEPEEAEAQIVVEKAIVHAESHPVDSLLSQAPLSPRNWPTAGEIRFEQVSLQYRKDLAPALIDISFTIKPGERIGVVGIVRICLGAVPNL